MKNNVLRRRIGFGGEGLGEAEDQQRYGVL